MTLIGRTILACGAGSAFRACPASKKLLYTAKRLGYHASHLKASPDAHHCRKIFWEFFNGIKEVRGVYAVCAATVLRRLVVLTGPDKR